MTRVKICGLTRPEDVRLAVALGADAIGFVFWPGSPRAVTPSSARAIAATVPPFVTRVGVFVDAVPAAVAAAIAEAGLDAVQLHGAEPVDRYRGLGVRLIKLVTLDEDQAVEAAAALPDDVTPIVDASDRERHGGTGRLAHWPRAAALAARRPVILAGGLTAENVDRAVSEVKPWAVDVSSGVEAAPGIKDHDRLAAFFAAVREAVR